MQKFAVFVLVSILGIAPALAGGGGSDVGGEMSHEIGMIIRAIGRALGLL